MNYHKYPPPPPESQWRFVKDLNAPVHRPLRFPPRRPAADEFDLSQGLRLMPEFADPLGRLETAYADFNAFLRLTELFHERGCPVVPCRRATAGFEEFCITAQASHVEVGAQDSEGIRRGLIYLEDEMLRRNGPFLPKAPIRRAPVIRTRLSRCFYGPINRPPKCRDELSDDIDYYPDNYLNRLAHDGVNALWITLEFKKAIPSKIIPEYGSDSARQLAKLRRTVRQCARFGIKIFVFCIEPAAFAPDSPILAAHPGLAGFPYVGNGRITFCPLTHLGRAYLEEAARTLFGEVPGLGGLVDITVGERLTHCCSVAPQLIACPRCSRKKPWEVLAQVLTALERGMHAAAPAAELISWPYGQYLIWGENLTRAAAGRVPPRVILQHNFESAGKTRQLGCWRKAEDYWLSYIGPSALFRACARRTAQSGRRMFAKLQVGCSHEVATVPHVPVPGNLYRKYKNLHRLGVSGVMQSWYFGNYPSLMTRAAGLLSFEPFPKTEADFLLNLAQRDWPAHAPQVVRAWRWFQRGYAHYPFLLVFGYYGPMHDGPVWPLYLIPRDRALAPNWLAQYPPSGDRIGEAIGFAYTLAEVLVLCGRLTRDWDRGVTVLKRLAPYYQHDPERLRDLRVAEALGIQFRSGWNILRFYAWRDRLIQGQGARAGILRRMAELVCEELRLNARLLKLAQADSVLGFHSEAESHKYYPANIRWRMRQLRNLLRVEFPAVRRLLRGSAAAWAQAMKQLPSGACYRCGPVSRPPSLKGWPHGAVWDDLDDMSCDFAGDWQAARYARLSDPDRYPRRTTWRAGYDRHNLYFGVECREPDMTAVSARQADRQMRYWYLEDGVELFFEPRRFWPGLGLIFNSRGARYVRAVNYPQGDLKPDYRWRVRVCRSEAGWSATVKIPWRCLGMSGPDRPIRFNLTRWAPRPGQPTVGIKWLQPHPLQSRLIYGSENAARDYGWLLFPDDKSME